jgi:hypothetical protein
MLLDRHSESEEFQNLFEYYFGFSGHQLVDSEELIVDSPVQAGRLPF